MSGPFEVGPAGGEVGPGGEEVGPATDANPAAGLASGTGTAYNASASNATTASAGAATGSGTAYNASPATAHSATAGAAAGTGAAANATVTVSTSVHPGVAAGTGTAYNATAVRGIAGSAGIARGTGTAYDPLIVIDGAVVTPPGTGNPSYPWTLFRGAVIGVDMTRQAELLVLTLDCEDYNRLAPLIKVGAPVFGNFRHVPDPPPLGTDEAIDPNAQTFYDSPSAAGYVSFFTPYWFSMAFGIDTTTYVDDIVGDETVHLPDFSTALTDWKSFSDTYLHYMGPYSRAWLDPDMKLHVTQLAPFGTFGLYALSPPWTFDEDTWTPQLGDELSGDGGDGFADLAWSNESGVILPMRLSMKWDFVKLRQRLFVRGGTPPASLWQTAAVIARAGEEYYDAPGAVTAADSTAIAEWAFATTFKTTATGSVHVESGHDGWRVGQQLRITSSRLSTPGRELAATPAPLLGFTGRLVGPGAGLTLVVGGVDVSERVTWRSFQFGESISGPEKATITIEITADETLDIAELADVRVTTDGGPYIEYDLNFGDVEPGDLAKALTSAELPVVPFVKPVYHFEVTVYDPLVPLYPTVSAALGPVMVKAQLSDDAKKPVALANVIMEWSVDGQWSDPEKTVPAARDSDPTSPGIYLADSTGTTDAAGTVYTTISAYPDSDAVAYEVTALALPISP